MRHAARFVALTLVLGTIAVPALAAGSRANAPELKWNPEIQWKSWEEAKKIAKEQDKRICLVVYTNWCPRCKELAPKFKEESLIKLTEDLVMVKQNGDEKPAWLMDGYGKYGTYIPRILFLEPDGTVKEELTGGNPKYPYYYWPSNPKLAENMKIAGKGE